MAADNSTAGRMLWDLGEPVKRCAQCGELKPTNQFSLVKHKRKKKPYRNSYCRTCIRRMACEYARKQRATNPEYVQKKHMIRRRWYLAKRFGLSLADYEAMLAAQNGRCAICREIEDWNNSRVGKPGPLAVDHCHSTGQVRGLLCNACNLLLAMAQDKVDVLRSAIAYLERSSSGRP